jgi:hypothetical protein
VIGEILNERDIQQGLKFSLQFSGCFAMNVECREILVTKKPLLVIRKTDRRRSDAQRQTYSEPKPSD